MRTAVSNPAPATGALVQRRSPGLDETITEARGLRELHLTLRPLPHEPPTEMFRRLAEALNRNQAAIARMEVFGDLAARSSALQALQQCMGPLDWPVTWVEGAGCGPGPLAGLHVLAITGAPVSTVRLRGRAVGRVFTDPWATHLLLGDLRPDHLHQPKPAQAVQVYETLEAAAQKVGMTVREIVRTWMFLDDILSWYGPFNEVRTTFYRQRGVFEHLVPASTGVGVKSVGGAALTAGAWAVQPTNGAFTVRELASPKQCAATEYGSSFSRAVELGTPLFHRVLVSGTASIEPGGRSVCDNDVEGQIDLTMEVIRALLVSRGMDLADASRVTAYFKRREDAPAFEAWRRRAGLQEWPVVLTQADICRPELLFEIELDALKAR